MVATSDHMPSVDTGTQMSSSCARISPAKRVIASSSSPMDAKTIWKKSSSLSQSSTKYMTLALCGPPVLWSSFTHPSKQPLRDRFVQHGAHQRIP
jgi:hypothetical protein